MKLSKFLIGLIFFISFINFFCGADELSLIRNTDVFPSNHNWNPDEEVTTTSAVWTIYNNTDNAIEIDETFFKAEGNVDDTSFILDLIYEKDGVELYHKQGVFLLDNGTILLQVQDGKVIIPANDFVYFKINYSVNSGESVNEGEFFYNYLKSIEATDLVTDSSFSWVGSGNGLTSSIITIVKPSVYVLELVGENGTISWVTNYEDVYTDGNSIKSANYVNEDFLFRIYKNCALFIDADGVGSQSKITFYSPIGQSFLSSSEDFSSIAVKLRSTGLKEPENITARIRKDSINGEILKETTKLVDPVLYDSWILFEFDSCGESVCGNNVIETGEECDGDYLNGKSCGFFDGFIQGTLKCNASCEYDTSSCVSKEEYAINMYCNNGVIDTEYEECDNSDFGNKTCTDYQFDLGNLVCDSQCKIDSSNCFNKEIVVPDNNPNNDNMNSVCGNNVLEIGENCDTEKLGGKNCVDFGFGGGKLGCSASCAYDFSKCTHSNWTDHIEPNEGADLDPNNTDNNTLLDDNTLLQDNNTIIDDNTIIDTNSATQNEIDNNSDFIDFENKQDWNSIFNLKNPNFNLLLGASIIGLLIIIGLYYFYKSKKKFKNK